MCLVGLQVVQRVLAPIEHLHLQWVEFVGERMGHYLRGERVICPLDEFIYDGWGFAFQRLPH